jgi:hypothetical protein
MSMTRGEEDAVAQEYEAARVAFVAAGARMTAAKARMRPVLEARERRKENEKLAALVPVVRAILDGASKQQVQAMLERKQPPYSVWDVADRFIDPLLSWEERYRNPDLPETHSEAWYRRIAEMALERYRERVAA